MQLKQKSKGSVLQSYRADLELKICFWGPRRGVSSSLATADDSCAPML